MSLNIIFWRLITMLGKLIRSLAVIITIIGALNWGLVGTLQLDIIAKFFNGPTSGVSRLLYIIVGISGLVTISTLRCICKSGHHCHSDSSCCSKDHHS